MESPDRYKIQEKISSIRKAIDQLSPGNDLGFESSFRPSLFNRIDSASSFNSERSLDRFLEEKFEADNHRVDLRPSLNPVEEKSLDYSREERPLSRSPSLFNRSNHDILKSYSTEELRQGSPKFRESFKTTNGISRHDDREESWENSMIVDVEKQRLTNLESKLREKDSYIEELSIKNTRLMRDIEDFSIKNTRLVREIEDFSIKMRSSSEETSKIAEMYNKIEVLEGKNYRLQETCNNYQEKLTAKEIQLKNFEYEKVKNDRFDDEKFKRLEEAEREINRLVKDRSNLMAENEDLRFQAENQEKQIITSKSIILDQQREVSRLSSLRGSKESEISHLQEEIDRMTAQNKEDCQRLEDEIRRLVKKNRDLEADFSEVVKKAPENNDKKNEFTIFKLKSEVESLRNENENVIMELNSRPTVKQHKECLRKLEELEVNVSQSRGRSKNRSQSTTPHRLGTHNTRESIRKDREMHSLTAGQLPSSKTLQLIIIDIMEYLKLENASEILPNIRKLEENRENTKFIRRMAQLIKECSPPGAFHTDPSTKVIWKWVRRLMEDYLILKKRMLSG